MGSSNTEKDAKTQEMYCIKMYTTNVWVQMNPQNATPKLLVLKLQLEEEADRC